MLEAVADHRIQLALIEGPGLRKDLRIEPFMEDKMVLVVPAGHDWSGQEIEARDLMQAPLLMREFGSGSRRVIENALAKIGVKKKDLKTVMELDSTEGLLSAVPVGPGAAWECRSLSELHPKAHAAI
jgi:DNA-binding transcriptional LysR family regulator